MLFCFLVYLLQACTYLALIYLVFFISNMLNLGLGDRAYKKNEVFTPCRYRESFLNKKFNPHLFLKADELVH